MKIAIVVSRFNKDITEKLLEGAKRRLLELDIASENIAITWVPGAVELPLIAQQYALSKKFHAIICFGAVVHGETDHYRYVCQQASEGCQQVMLKHNIPVIFGVLTTLNHEQALARAGGDRGHVGREYAESAVEMARIMQHFAIEHAYV